MKTYERKHSSLFDAIPIFTNSFIQETLFSFIYEGHAVRQERNQDHELIIVL